MRLTLQRFALPAVLVLGLSVRIMGINSRPIWYDEAFSVLFSDKGPGAMLVGTLTSTAAGAAEEHPLAYYVLLWAWMRAFGESLIAVRALSVLAGLLVVLVVYLFARNLISQTTAIAAGLIVALSPFQVHYSQEIRMYVFLTLWLLLATYAYWRAGNSSGWKWWAAFAVFAALAQYTHNLAAFYLAALALWPVITRDWRPVRGVLLSGFAALLLYLPWLIHLPAQFAKVGQTYWIEKPGLYRALTLLLMFVTNLPLPASWLAVGLFLALAVVTIAAWQTVRAAHSAPTQARVGLWLLYLAFAPAVLLFLFSQWKPIYLERALLPSGAIFCIWLAWALFETKAPDLLRAVVACLILVAFVMGLYQHMTDSGGLYGPFQPMMQRLETSRSPGDVVIHSDKLSMLPSVYFDRALPQTYLADRPNSPENTLAPATQKVLGLPSQPDIETAVGSATRVWFIIFDESLQEYLRAGYTTHPQIAWLSQHYSLVQVQSWGTLRLYLFSK